jgi:hypothetical protein
MAFIVAFIALFLDPVLAVPAIACGALIQRWPVIIAVCVALGVAHEAFLFAISFERNFSPLSVVAGSLAALLWCAMSRVIADQVRKRRAAAPPL